MAATMAAASGNDLIEAGGWLQRLLYSCLYDVQMINETWGERAIFDQKQGYSAHHPLRHDITLAIRDEGLRMKAVFFAAPDEFLSGFGALAGKGDHAKLWRAAHTVFSTLLSDLRATAGPPSAAVEDAFVGVRGPLLHHPFGDGGTA